MFRICNHNLFFFYHVNLIIYIVQITYFEFVIIKSISFSCINYIFKFQRT